MNTDEQAPTVAEGHLAGATPDPEDPRYDVETGEHYRTGSCDPCGQWSRYLLPVDGGSSFDGQLLACPPCHAETFGR